LGYHPNTLRNWEKLNILKPVRAGVRGDRHYTKSQLESILPSIRDSHARQVAPGVPKVVSFFSGCGGLDLGFEKAGFRTVFANDIFLPSAETYAKNIGPIDTRPIETIPLEDVPTADVLLAGFPCQPFSNAGSRKGTSDPRGTLFFETLRFVDEKQPKILVFENVKGLLSIVNPDGRKLIDAIIDELENRGYAAQYRLLKASDYGVPQNRERVFIVGVRKSFSDAEFQYPEKITNFDASLGNALRNLPKDDPNDEHWPLSPQAQHLVNYIPEGGSWKSVDYDLLPTRLKKIRDDMKKYHSPNFYRRFARNEIAGTVTAAGTPENSGVLHPTEPRRYTIREIARIQSFDDDFIFYGRSLSAKHKQIGNAVPPKLAAAVAKAIREQYFN
jgi:DNA (cytosine-5)-methyltransferase 1